MPCVCVSGVCVCVDHLFWVLAASVCVHGPPVLGFGTSDFHGFDGPVYLCACIVHGPQVLGFDSFDGPVHLCVCVHGPLVLGFGGFHGFDGPVNLCVCTWFWVLVVFTVLINGPQCLSICVCTWTTGFGFWWFSWF